METIKGKTPVITIGDNGNWFVDGVDTGVLALGTKGDDGEKGEKGDTGKRGEKGESGLSLLTGSNAPNNSEGNFGDSYIDLSTWNYYVKIATEWILKGNLQVSVESPQKEQCEHILITDETDDYIVENGFVYFVNSTKDCVKCDYKTYEASNYLKVPDGSKFVVFYNHIGEVYHYDFYLKDSDDPLQYNINQSYTYNDNKYVISSWTKLEEIGEIIKYKANVNEAKTITISTQNEEFIKSAIELYKQKNKEAVNCDFEIVYGHPNDSLSDFLINQENAPDIMFGHTGETYIKQCVEENLIAEIPNSYIKELNINDDLYKKLTFDDKVYGIPYCMNSYYLHYDASVYSKDVVKSLNKMLDVDINKKLYEYNFALEISNYWYSQSLFFSNGCSIFGDDGNDLTKAIEPYENGLEVSKFIWNMYNGANSDKIYKDGLNTSNMNYAAVVTGIWETDVLKNQIESRGGIYACAPLPYISFDGENEVPWKAVSDSISICVNNLSQNKDVALDFAVFLTSAECQKLNYSMDSSYYPTNSDFYEDESIEWTDDFSSLKDQINNLFNQPMAYHERSSIWSAFSCLSTDLSSCKETETVNLYNDFLSIIVPDFEPPETDSIVIQQIYTVSELHDLMDIGIESDTLCYLTGQVKNVSFSTAYQTYSLELEVPIDADYVFEIYAGKLEDGLNPPEIGDTIIVYGLTDINGECYRIARKKDSLGEYVDPIICSVS